MRRSSSHPTNTRGIPALPPHHNRPLIYYHRSSSSSSNNNNNNNFPATRNAHRLSPNFIIDLHLDPTIAPSNKRPDPNIVNSVISQCKPTPPPDRTIFPTTTTSRTKLTASLHFQEWSHTLNFMIALWELRLRGAHSFTPKLQSHILVASDAEELKRNLTKKFSDYIEGFIEGVASNVNDDESVVGRWQAKVSEKSDEIAQVMRLLRGRNKPRNFIELNERKEGLMAERDLIVKRLREFRASMNCILKYIEGGREKEGERGLEVFVFDGEIDWERIHRLVLREIRRLVDGLPIYAYRQQILEMIHSKQHYMNDTTLSGISCIIVDEAHERSLNTDLLLALIRGLLCERRDLRLVIMSATANAKQLSDYFYGCEIFHVEGRNFPVEVRYTPSSEGTAFGNVSPYMHDILRTTTEIHKQESEGTILAFLTSQMEVEWACEKFDAPSAVPLALHGKLPFEEQSRAVTLKCGICELTEEGRYMVKLGIEPRLGKIIISSLHYRLGKEGLVLAAFCHRNGDLFTVLSVYKEWEAVPQDRRNRWCWENSINAKSMRRCQDTVKELEFCLEKELTVIIPSYWNWNPNKSTEHDKYLKKIILSALAENVAMHSGHDRLGYKVALTEQHIQLHPSCSLLAFGEKPNWVVFSELLSISNDYLVCVTAFDVESLSMLCPPPLFDALKMESQKLQVKVLTSFGSSLLKRFCGKSNSNLHSLVTCIRIACMDERIGVEVHVDKNEILLFATAESMQKVFSIVSEAVECERKWLHSECMEKFLYLGADSSPMALFGAGAEIKYLELEKRCLTVDILFSNANTIDDKELLMFLEEYTSGTVCSIHKSIGSGQEGDEKEKWGQITFLSPDAARKAAQLNEVEFKGSKLKVVPSQTIIGGNHKMFPFPAVKAKLCWPRKVSKGLAIVKCFVHEVNFMICDFSNLRIGGRYVRCNAGRCADSVVVSGFSKELSEADVLGALRSATNRRILEFFILRGDAVENPPLDACEKALSREISPFMPKRNPQTSCWRVQVFPPELKGTFMKAFITFDGRLHLEAARALEHMEGKVLPGFLSWQKIKCERIFHSLISCSASIYVAIKKQLDSLLARFNRVKGAECSLDRNENGSYRVRISADATKTVAELRRPLEELMRGQTINHPSLTPTIIQHLFSSQGIDLMKSIQRETGTYIHFDRRNFSLKIFGCSDKIAPAQQKFVQLLLADHESKQLEIHLRGRDLPPDLMKEVVKRFGPDLHGLKEKVPGAELTLSTRHHVISVRGDKELKQKVEEIIFEMAQMGYDSAEKFDGEDACPICLCEFEDAYQLESWLPILLTDLRSLLSSDKLEELFRASLGSFVASSRGTYRFCPSPDCPSVYRVADPHTVSDPFVCGACFAETCTRCHLDYHPYISCEKYMEFKEDPDVSLQDWCKGKENVKSCPVCGYTIEKGEGCNHVECKCGGHVCWVCLEFYSNSEDCYNHLRSKHGGIA
ncbi:hypothetical protein OIU78_020966 [Salix suchowensis]|nr:hypothetical protein OIU78_020966 [Salix suchowensis]